MKKILLILVLSLTAITLSAQRENLDKMPEEQRNKILLEIAKEVMLEYAPGYYNESTAPKITDLGLYVVYNNLHPGKSGVRIYQVYYYYDKKKLESDENIKSIFVEIWADDGKLYGIGISGGNGLYTTGTSLKNDIATRSSEVKKPYYKFGPPRGGMRFIPKAPSEEGKEWMYKRLDELKGKTTEQAEAERKSMEDELKRYEIMDKEYNEWRAEDNKEAKLREETDVLK